jgi:hypothetical protein
LVGFAPAQVLDIFQRVQESFPKAEVRAAGPDGFVGDVLEAADQLDLPVVTGEIGDTWWVLIQTCVDLRNPLLSPDRDIACHVTCVLPALARLPWVI